MHAELRSYAASASFWICSQTSPACCRQRTPSSPVGVALQKSTRLGFSLPFSGMPTMAPTRAGGEAGHLVARQHAGRAGVALRDAEARRERRAALLPGRALARRTVGIAREDRVEQADVRLAELLGVIGDRRPVERASLGKLRDARRGELAGRRRQAVRQLGDQRRRRRRRRLGIELAARVDPGRQADRPALRVAVGVGGRVARVERRRVERVRGVQVRLAEERLAQRVVVRAVGALLGAHEGRVAGAGGAPGGDQQAERQRPTPRAEFAIHRMPYSLATARGRPSRRRDLDGARSRNLDCRCPARWLSAPHGQRTSRAGRAPGDTAGLDGRRGGLGDPRRAWSGAVASGCGAAPEALALAPRADRPGRRDRLWEHTCCEAFVGARRRGALPRAEPRPVGGLGAVGVRRLPGRDARRGERRAAAARASARRASCASTRSSTRPSCRASSACRRDHVGLAAVIEEQDGRRSFHALAHAAERPDFHARESVDVPVYPSPGP